MIMKAIKAILAFLAGSTGLSWKLVLDAISAVLGRIAWPIILERLFTRIAVATLNKLAAMKSNRLSQQTVDDIKAQLLKDGLKKAVE